MRAVRRIVRLAVTYDDGATQEWEGAGSVRVHNTTQSVETGGVNPETGKPKVRKDPYTFVEAAIREAAIREAEEDAPAQE